MADLNFYSELRNKFGSEFPREFWFWLSTQDIKRPLWTRLGDDITLRKYLQQMNQDFSKSTQPSGIGAKAIYPEAYGAAPTPPPQPAGWDIEKYLAAVNAGLDADTVSQKEYDKRSKEEREGLYTPEMAQAEKDRILKLSQTTTDPTLLPSWGEYRSDWVYLNGTIKVQGELFQMPDGSYYDIKGNPVSAQSAAQTMGDFYKTNQNQMSDYQKAQLEFDITEAKRSAGQFQQAQAGQREELAEKKRQFDITHQQSTAEQIRQKKEQDFEIEREKQLAGWSAPSDWIRRWQRKMEPNPFTPVSMTLQEQAEAGLYEIEQAKQQMLQFQGTARPNEFVETAQGWITPYEKNLQELTNKWLPVIQQQQAVAAEQSAAYEEQRGITGEYPTFRRAPTTPPAPAWLSQFAPGQAEGKPITAQNIVTPSGQQWARTPWSVREGVRGYQEWTQGKPYEEVIEEMESMLPRSPRGVASRRWTPTRQWA